MPALYRVAMQQYALQPSPKGLLARCCAPRHGIACRSVGSASGSKAGLIEFLTAQGFQPAEVQRAVTRNPVLTETSVEQKVEPMLNLLRDRHVQLDDIELMLLRAPQLFTFSLEHKALPVLSFLSEDLGLNEQQVTSVIRRYPNIMGFGVKSHLIPHVAYLKSLGLSHEQLAPLVLARPQVLGTSIEMIIKYLKLIRVSRCNIGRLLQTYPYDYMIPDLHVGGFTVFKEPEWLDIRRRGPEDKEGGDESEKGQEPGGEGGPIAGSS